MKIVLFSPYFLLLDRQVCPNSFPFSSSLEVTHSISKHLVVFFFFFSFFGCPIAYGVSGPGIGSGPQF